MRTGRLFFQGFTQGAILSFLFVASFYAGVGLAALLGLA